PFVGWASVDQKVFETLDFWDIWKMPLSKTASRFQVGTPSVISLVGARAAMKMLLDYGLENIRERICKLTEHLIKAVENLGLKLQTPLEEPCRSGIVNFRIAKAKKVEEKLAKKGIVVSARNNGIRVSPHYYNTEEEIEKLTTELQKS
ncbi:MAG: aminotransferase class V-fold PLP-dependent enzyme, partial [Candidatus Bathyarchaeia archaeon]